MTKGCAAKSFLSCKKVLRNVNCAHQQWGEIAVNIVDDEPKDPPHFFCLSMTETEDKILRELHKNGGRMDSEVLRSKLVLSESIHCVYGALSSLREMRYIDAHVIDHKVWVNDYRPLELSLTTRGRKHVLTTKPVRAGFLPVALYLILTGAIIAGIQSIWREPDYGPIGLSMLAAGIIILLARRAGLILNRKK